MLADKCSDPTTYTTSGICLQTNRVVPVIVLILLVVLMLMLRKRDLEQPYACISSKC